MRFGFRQVARAGLVEDSRVAVWRSPAGDPPWARPALLAILAAAVASYTWGVQRESVVSFYLGAVRTMADSWRMFFLGSFDPAGSLTLDKLPGAFWVQALSVRMFGFSAWSVIGPQIVEGLLTVAVTYRAVRRFAGPAAGLIASAVVTAMPVSTALSRGNVSDALSTLLLVLAADAALRAVASGRLRSLVCSGVWVGLAFQAKMIQAWLVLPVIGAVYLLAAAPRLRTRIGHVTIAVLVAVAVSLSWMSAVSLIPAAHRPWFDGSPHNSIFEQVFVYNGIGRFETGATFGVPRRVPPRPAPRRTPARTVPLAAALGAGGARPALAARPAQRHSESVSQIDTRPSSARLFYGGFALGVGWLLPLALAFGVLLAWARRGRPRTDLGRAAVVMWLAWTAGHVVVFSVLYHLNDYYTAILVPGIAALVGAGAVWAWRATPRWLVPAVLAGCTAYAVVLLGVAGSSWTWLRLLTAVVGAGAVAVTSLRALAAARGRRLRPLAWAGAGLAVTALLITPAAGSVAMDTHDGGPYTFGFAQRGIGVPVHLGDGWLQARYGRAESRLLHYIEPRAAGERYLLAASGSGLAAPLIAATGQDVLPIGGYLATMPRPTLAQLRHLIATHQLRFVATVPHSREPRSRWVQRSCRLVRGYPVRSDTSRTPAQLYDCAQSPRR